MGLYYGAVVGACVGAFVALWRLFGPTLLMVTVLAPALALGVLWLFRAPMASSAVHFLEQVLASAQREGLEHTAKAAGGMKMSCGGGGVAVFLLVLLSPFLLADAASILVDPSVLSSFLGFAAAMALAFGAALAVALLVSLPLLLLALVRRGRRRFRQLASA